MTDIAEITRLFNSNMPMKDIAKETNTSNATISRLCKKHGLKRDNILKKMSDKDLIKEYKTNKLSVIEIGNKYKISNQAITERLQRLNIIRNKYDRTILGADKTRKHHLNLEHFENMDEIGSYYLGFIFADGCVSCKHVNPSTISIGLNKKDYGWLSQFSNDIGLNSKIIYMSKNKNIATITINNLHFANILI